MREEMFKYLKYGAVIALIIVMLIVPLIIHLSTMNTIMTNPATENRKELDKAKVLEEVESGQQEVTSSGRYQVFVYNITESILTLKVNNVTVVVTSKEGPVAILYISIHRIKGVDYANCTLITRGSLWFSNQTQEKDHVRICKLLPLEDAFSPIIKIERIIQAYKVYLCRLYPVNMTFKYPGKERSHIVNVTLYKVVEVNETYVVGKAYIISKVRVEDNKVVEETYWYSNKSLISKREITYPIIVERVKTLMKMLNLTVLEIISYTHDYELTLPQPLVTIIRLNDEYGIVNNIVLPGAPEKIGYPKEIVEKMKFMPIAKICKELGIVHPYIVLSLARVET